MQVEQRSVYDDEIDVIELMARLWRGRWLILSVTVIFLIGAFIYVNLTKPVYKASVEWGDLLNDRFLEAYSTLESAMGDAGVSLSFDNGSPYGIPLKKLKSDFNTYVAEHMDLSDQIIGYSVSSSSISIEAHSVEGLDFLLEEFIDAASHRLMSLWARILFLEQRRHLSNQLINLTYDVELRKKKIKTVIDIREIELSDPELQLINAEKLQDLKIELALLEESFDLQKLQAQIDVLKRFLEKKNALTSLSVENIAVQFSGVVTSPEPIKPKKVLILIISLLIGFTLGCFIVFTKIAYEGYCQRKLNTQE